ncbi:MAG: cell surface protein SprA [Bacteroidota bacterium]
MERFLKYILYSVSFLLLITAVFGANPRLSAPESPPRLSVSSPVPRNGSPIPPPDSIDPDTIKPAPSSLTFPIPKEDPIFNGNQPSSPLYMADPENVVNSVEYDPETNRYYFVEKIGDHYYRSPNYMTFDEYLKYDLKNSVNNYFKQRSSDVVGTKRNALLPPIKIGGEAFDRIFGGNTVDIRPSGSAELTFGIISNRQDNPALDVKQRRTTNFDFQEKIQMSLIAKIGDKIEFKTNYNTEATFQFENKLKLKYEGKEDEIIKLIEAGDITMPLNSTLITGSQSLFGLKTKLQFGKTTVTAVFSQQESQNQTINVQGGAQTHEFSMTADQYEENRHFFLAQYFRDNYNKSLSQLPIINSSINITKIEVWVTNIGPAVTDNRNTVAFADLGEKNPYNYLIHTEPGYPFPSNHSNDLMRNLDTAKVRDINTVTNYLTAKGFISGEDYSKVELARRLTASEYTFNSKLGFISLNTTLNSDQTLAVAYQYTVIGFDSIFMVGEFSDQGISSPKCLVTKMLKSTNVNTHLPFYKLMMKNVYAIGAYQVMKDDFYLNILYRGNDNGVPTGYLTEGPIKGVPLIKVFNCDNLDPMLNPPGDGVFDFIDGAAKFGGTINSINGRVYFPVLEPFGKTLRDSLNDPTLADKYCYDSLYTLTKNGAQQYPDKNKFVIEGFYKSSSGSEIPLNAMNVPQGSVKVTAGGIPLAENVDFTVDYTLGRVRIINEGVLNSGTPVKITLENNSMFSVQTKRMMGLHADHRFSKDLNLGFTILNLTERPLTQKVNYGDEPISNTIWGMDFNYQKNAPFITKLIDKLPFYSTKAPSKILFEGEFAHFIPGHSKAVGKTGTSYIDDFEGSQSSIDLKNIGNWFIASTPQGQPDLFPESRPMSGLEYGFNRGKMSWYIIDQLFYNRTGTSQRPPNISKDEISKNLVRDVLETEVFPNKQNANNIPMNLPVLNLAFYPSQRGPYNYDVEGMPKFSFGINADGTLKRPETRWAGMMRKLETTDFEATNVESVEFWMMDPFTDQADPNNKGQLYIDLGDISEDILKDSRKSFEQGLPTSDPPTNIDTTIWGRVPTLSSLVQSFDNDPNARAFQDVGYDGLRDIDERSFFDSTYLLRIAKAYGVNSVAFTEADKDPSGDDYHYFRGGDYDQNATFSSVHERYKQFSQPEGNSPTDSQNPESYPTAATTIPNMEDINRDNTLSEEERYFQYRIDLDSSKMKVGTNYITDKYTAVGIPLPNGKTGTVTWYQFKVPISSPDRVVGNIQDFKSIRFMRMFFRGFQSPIICRLGTLELVRSEWRKYKYQLLAPGEYIPNDVNSLTSFDIGAVSIEENGKKIPIPYVLPPGIERELNMGTTTFQQMNEQSMSMKVCNMEDGDARAAYKTTDFDFRRYKRLKMYVHAEKSYGSSDETPGNSYPTGTLTCFIRLGSDFTENYYEYEVPLTFTPWFTSASSPNLIWPSTNDFDISLDDLVNVKQDRNIAMRSGSNISASIPYIVKKGFNTITVVGNPSLNDVKTIMIGVRNPKATHLNPSDDGLEKCAEIWVNELRLTDFDEKQAWAATARMNATLADLGNLTLSGLHSTAGFGSIEMKVNERQKETVTNWDIATNLELGKLLPKKAALKIPMHVDYSEIYLKPEYNPLNPDVIFGDDLATYNTQKEKDSIKSMAIDFTKRTNLNFVNVRREKSSSGPNSTPKFYDISNFDFTYAYSSVFQRNIDLKYDSKKQYRGGIGYNFNTTPKMVRPFSGMQALNKIKPLRLITDFNFYYLPKLFSVRWDMDRQYSERLLRQKSTGDIKIWPTYIKKWDWNRTYNVMFDLTQSIRIDYKATAGAYIKEPPGSIDKSSPTYPSYKDSIWSQVRNLGTMNNFFQSINADYNVPINKLPLLGWLNATLGYGADYRWISSPVSIQKRIGNTIENANTERVNLSANFTTLYNKVGYLKRLGQGGNKPNKNKPILPPKGTKPTATKQTGKGKDNSDSTKVKINYLKIMTEGVVKILISLKNASVTYTKGQGSSIPGFTPIPTNLGNNWSLNAPGLPFILGKQPAGPEDFRDFLSTDTAVNTAYTTKMNEMLNFRASLEPFTDFRVELTGNRTFTKNFQEYYRADAAGDFHHSAPMTMGTFSISYITFGTAFGDIQGKKSKAFENLKKYRLEIAQRQSELNPNYSGSTVDSTGYPLGYGPVSQDVLVPAFLAAYSGRGPGNIPLTTLPAIPLPNWRITYNGLSRIEGLKRYLRSVNISHAYRSTYTVGSYATNILYNEVDGFPSMIDPSGNFIPKYETDVVSISEQFNPLIDIDMTWTNSLLTKIEIRKNRNLSLSFTNNQLTEVISNEFIVGVGYRFKDVQFQVKSMATGSKTTLKSDLILKLDFSIKSNKTTLRRLDEDVDQISAGQKVLSINSSAEYMISPRFNVRVFFDKVVNNPYISSSFPNSTTNGGITLRFTLAQ